MRDLASTPWHCLPTGTGYTCTLCVLYRYHAMVYRTYCCGLWAVHSSSTRKKERKANPHACPCHACPFHASMAWKQTNSGPAPQNMAYYASMAKMYFFAIYMAIYMSHRAYLLLKSLAKIFFHFVHHEYLWSFWPPAIFQEKTVTTRNYQLVIILF